MEKLRPIQSIWPRWW